MVDNVKVSYQSDAYSSGGTKYVLNHLVDTPGVENTEQRGQQNLAFSCYCPHCNLNFDDKIEYEHHNVEMHGHKKNLVCQYCQSVFRRQDHLKRHILSLHETEKYFKCSVCDKDCKRQDMLLKHIRSRHATESIVFRCPDCAFVCNNLTSFDNHKVTHMLTDRHTCVHCKTTFKRRDHMVRHVKSQHLKQSIACPLCPQLYKRKDHVVRHVREKHKMGYLNGKLVRSSDIII